VQLSNETGRYGNVYTSTRNALGLEGAKKTTTFRFNDRANPVDQDDFGLLFFVVKGEPFEGAERQEQGAC
jgi:hypothetical protein